EGAAGVWRHPLPVVALLSDGRDRLQGGDPDVSGGFPQTSIWFSGGDVLLVGSTSPLVVDLDRYLTRAADLGVSRTLVESGIHDGASLLGFFMLDRERAAEYAGSGPPFHTDIYPLLEFSAPKTLYRESAPNILSNLRRFAARSELSLAGVEGRNLA